MLLRTSDIFKGRIMKILTQPWTTVDDYRVCRSVQAEEADPSSISLEMEIQSRLPFGLVEKKSLSGEYFVFSSGMIENHCG